MNKINWKLIFQLSIFGLVMAVATISLIPANYEYFFWLVIFVLCGYIVAKNAPGQYFLHGFLISLVNSVWITIAHVLYASVYLANHPQMQEMTASMPLVAQHHQRTMMVFLALPFGAAFGLLLGLFCFIASKVIRKRVAA
jgi:hypothetical protein